MGVKKEEREPVSSLKDAQGIIFKIANDEMEGHLHALRIMQEAMAEMQRQRYIAVFQVVEELGWNEEFAAYRKAVRKERTMTKK